LELYRRKKVDVKANSGSSVSFMIIPRELGYITIKATANSVLAGDSVEHKLLVNVIISFYLLLAWFLDDKQNNKHKHCSILRLKEKRNIGTKQYFWIWEMLNRRVQMSPSTYLIMQFQDLRIYTYLPLVIILLRSCIYYFQKILFISHYLNHNLF